MVEIEGKEMLDIPGRGVGQAVGPSHENGGIKVELPQGTKIYSKRLKVDGKTMAARKEARTKLLDKIFSKLSDRPYDALERNSLNRTLETTTMEDYSDLMTQETKSNPKGEFKYGGMTKYADGTGPFGTPPGGPGYPVPVGTTPDLSLLQAMLASNPTDPLPTIAPNPVSLAPQAPIGTVVPQQPVSPSGGGGGGILGALGSIGSAGIGAGPAGLAVGALGPLVTTLVNRIGDKKNPNYYENYGQQGLATNSLSQGRVDATRQDTLGQIDQTRVGTEGLIASNSRSASTLRSNQQLNSSNTQDAQRKANTDAAINLSSLLSQRAGMLNERDKVVMAGKEKADVSDRMDRDQFFTNLSSNLSNAGTGLLYAARNKKSAISLDDIFKF